MLIQVESQPSTIWAFLGLYNRGNGRCNCMPPEVSPLITNEDDIVEVRNVGSDGVSESGRIFY